MKKRLLLITFLVIDIYAFTQNTFPSTGNVGIGITNPQLKLVVAAQGANVSMEIAAGTNKQSAVVFTDRGDGAGGLGYAFGRDLNSNGTNDFFLYNYVSQITPFYVQAVTGYIGIGTSSPAAKFDVLGNVSLLTGTHKLYINELYSFDPAKAGLRNNAGNLGVNAKDAGVLYLNRDVNADTRIQSTVGGNTIDIAVFKSNGSVCIGTDVFPATDAKLAVKGIIYSQKIKVTQNGWADYVFDASYRLRPLSEVEKFIKQNNHLPEVPSAAEVEENGLDLGDNQATLLKKIEELTLYIIDLNKRVENQENLIRDQKEQIKMHGRQIKKVLDKKSLRILAGM